MFFPDVMDTTFSRIHVLHLLDSIYKQRIFISKRLPAAGDKEILVNFLDAA